MNGVVDELSRGEVCGAVEPDFPVQRRPSRIWLVLNRYFGLRHSACIQSSLSSLSPDIVLPQRLGTRVIIRLQYEFNAPAW